MLFLSDVNKPYIVDSLTQPIIPKYHWIFSAHMLDFTLAPMQYLEESSGPAIELIINDFPFYVPASWNILIVDEYTYQIDTIPVTACANAKSYAFSMSPIDSKIRKFEITIGDFKPNMSLVHPMIQRATGLCHPIGTTPDRIKDANIDVDVCCIIGPFDLHKWLNNKIAGDIL
jgi:hypothetical protein